jgi:ribosomal protein L11 methyltransferase
MLTPPVIRATLAVGDEKLARRVADVLTEIFDSDEVAVAAFEVTEGNWEISAHFAQTPDQDAIRAIVAQAAGDDAAQALQFDTVAAKDWVAASLEGLKPVTAGQFIVHGQHDRARVRPNQIAIEIEAALAFGTGHHGTTRGCLLLLHDVLRRYRPRRMLDLGTGTGVLAIAAAKALHTSVLATDIDAKSVEVTRDNARLNGVGDLIEAVHATGFGSRRFARRAPFDLIMANILANPLRALAPAMTRHLAPGAIVILSGLLPAHARGVIAAYRAQGVMPIRRIELEGWCSLLMQNKR